MSKMNILRISLSLTEKRNHVVSRVSLEDNKMLRIIALNISTKSTFYTTGFMLYS